jgi:hypothetical protein
MNRLPDMCRYKKSLNNFVRFEISLEMAEEKNLNGESKNVF